MILDKYPKEADFVILRGKAHTVFADVRDGEVHNYAEFRTDAEVDHLRGRINAWGYRVYDQVLGKMWVPNRV